MVHFWKLRRDRLSPCEDSMPAGVRVGSTGPPRGAGSVRSPGGKPLSLLSSPGLFLVSKLAEYKRQQQDQQRRKQAERELDSLNVKIDRLLSSIDERDVDLQTEDDECVVCLVSKATMQTFPCSHKVVCRKCFIKTIQVAVAQRSLPLRCVICRTRILKLKQASHSSVNVASSALPSPSQRHASAVFKQPPPSQKSSALTPRPGTKLAPAAAKHSALKLLPKSPGIRAFAK